MRPRPLCGSASEIMFGWGVSLGGQCINCTVVAVILIFISAALVIDVDVLNLTVGSTHNEGYNVLLCVS